MIKDQPTTATIHNKIAITSTDAAAASTKAMKPKHKRETDDDDDDDAHSSSLKKKTKRDKSPSNRKKEKKNNQVENKKQSSGGTVHFQLYGKLCKIATNGRSCMDHSNNGKCFVCQDAKSSKLPKDHPILLCEGEGCSRQFHLQCITTPSTLQLGEDPSRRPFYCKDCDPMGTSACLNEYFDALEELRAEFNSSKELVHFLLALHTRGIFAKRLLKDLGSVNAKVKADREDVINRCIERVTTIDMKKALPKQNDAELFSDDLDLHELPVSELSRATELHYAALDVPSFMACVDDNKDKKEQESTATNNNTKKQSYDDVSEQSFVGKMVRLYCPVDNQYHHGRIIDWRTARIVDPSICPESTLYNDYFEGTNDVSKSEFLIRFPAGINGRKKTVMQWIIFEEHSIAVSMSMVMAQRDRGRGVNGWKPAQIVLRSIIELLPCKALINKQGHFALAIFFGDENHLYTDLDREAVDYFSPEFEKYKSSKMNLSPNVKKSYVQGIAAFMDMAMALVQMELEEQKRTLSWHKLMLFDYSHPQCFSMKSEYGLPPLIMNVDGCADDDGGGDRNTIKMIKTIDMKMEKEVYNGLDHRDISSSINDIIPQLCPLIQQGLDRQYLCNQLCDQHGFNLDTIATLKCTTTNVSTKVQKIRSRLDNTQPRPK